MDIIKIVKLINCSVIIFSVMACASAGRKIDQNAVEKIKNGDSKQEVLSLIGSPDSVYNLNTGEVIWSYVYVHVAVTPITLIPVVGIFAGGAKSQHQTVTITFNVDGKVKNVVSGYGGTEADSNLAAGSKSQMPEVENNKRPKE